MAYLSKAQGGPERAERKPSEPERFFQLGRTRIGLERSGCAEICRKQGAWPFFKAVMSRK